jgi:protein-S-isoprenylcysteine O-methyltransferase Ste14
MRAVDVAIGLCWIIFWVFWLLAATQSKPGQGRWTRCAGIRVAVVILVVALVHGVGFRWHSVNSDPVLSGVGLALFVLGLALAVWARLYIGRNWGVPMSHKDEPELVTTGPYHRIRHPIYTGLILALLGTALATSLYGLIVVAVLGGFFIYSAIREEAYLTEQFQDTYRAYKHSTKMLIPFVF